MILAATKNSRPTRVMIALGMTRIALLLTKATTCSKTTKPIEKGRKERTKAHTSQPGVDLQNTPEALYRRVRSTGQPVAYPPRPSETTCPALLHHWENEPLYHKVLGALRSFLRPNLSLHGLYHEFLDPQRPTATTFPVLFHR